jgi:hypothetical protein
MISVRMNNLDLDRKLNNTVKYSNGFLEGIEMERLQFNRILGGIAAESLGVYIDSKARMSPESLHHVYEWNSVGQKDSRLFSFNVDARKSFIAISGKFLPSTSLSEGSNTPFVDKANVMENKISIIIEPKNSSVLVFEDGSETVFTTKSIRVDNPGGNFVSGSFESVVDEFFNQYFDVSVLKKILNQLKNPKEFSQYFSQGTKSGRSAGVVAGRRYFTVKGLDL